MQDKGAAGGSAAGARSVELEKAEKTIKSLKYEIDQVRPFLEELTDLMIAYEDLKSEKVKLEGENARLKRDKVTYRRTLANLWKQKKELRRLLRDNRKYFGSLRKALQNEDTWFVENFYRLSEDHRNLLGKEPNLSEAKMDALLKEQEAAHVRLLKCRVRNVALEKLKKDPSFVCPITFEVFNDPVIVADGHTYERKDITEWIRDNRHFDVNRQYVWKSPMTGAHFRSTDVFPNIDKKTAIFNALEVAVDELVAKRRRINTPAP